MVLPMHFRSQIRSWLYPSLKALLGKEMYAFLIHLVLGPPANNTHWYLRIKLEQLSWSEKKKNRDPCAGLICREKLAGVIW